MTDWLLLRTIGFRLNLNKGTLKHRPLLARGTVVEGYTINRHLKTQQNPSCLEIPKHDTTQSNPSINQSAIDKSIRSLLLLQLDAAVSFRTIIEAILVRSRSRGYHHDSMVGAQPRKERHAITEPRFMYKNVTH